jgi:hypothetical protein
VAHAHHARRFAHSRWVLAFAILVPLVGQTVSDDYRYGQSIMIRL